MVVRWQNHLCTVNLYNKLPKTKQTQGMDSENAQTYHNKNRYSYLYKWNNILSIFSKSLILSTSESLLKLLIYLMVHIWGG